MSRPRERVVRASEIGQYAYCAHAWWLGSVQGLPSSRQHEMSEGEAVHARHGRGVRLSDGLRRLAYLILGLAVLLGALVLGQWLGR